MSNVLSFIGTRISIALSEGAPTEFIAVKLSVFYLSVTITRRVISSIALLTKLSISTVTVCSKVILQRICKAGFSWLCGNTSVTSSPCSRRLKDIVIVLCVRTALDLLKFVVIRLAVVAWKSKVVRDTHVTTIFPLLLSQASCRLSGCLGIIDLHLLPSSVYLQHDPSSMCCSRWIRLFLLGFLYFNRRVGSGSRPKLVILSLHLAITHFSSSSQRRCCLFASRT